MEIKFMMEHSFLKNFTYNGMLQYHILHTGFYSAGYMINLDMTEIKVKILFQENKL